MKSALPLLLLLTLGTSALSQTTTVGKMENSGDCSFTSINASNSIFKISCGGKGLRPEEAKQLAQILTIVRKSDLQFTQVLQSLKALAIQAKINATVAAETNAKLALSAAPIYTIPVIDGIATPDLSHGLTQRVVLHSDIVIAPPRLPQTSKDETIVWTLFVDQDATGNHKYTTEFLAEKTTWPGLIGNASSSFELITESTGHTRMRGMPIGNMLTTEAPPKK